MFTTVFIRKSNISSLFTNSNDGINENNIMA